DAVAGVAGDQVAARQARVEEQHPPQLDLRRRQRLAAQFLHAFGNGAEQGRGGGAQGVAVGGGGVRRVGRGGGGGGPARAVGGRRFPARGGGGGRGLGGGARVGGVRGRCRVVAARSAGHGRQGDRRDRQPKLR